MNRRKSEQLSPQMLQAIDELKTLIKTHYPDAQFEVERAADEPEAILLVTTVDIDTTEDILDLVIDRVIDLQVEDRIPIHVIPLRPIKRVIADMQRPKARPYALTEEK